MEGFFYEEDPFEDQEEYEVGYLLASCECGWRGSGMFFRGDRADLEKSAENLKKEHATTGCGSQPHIGIS